MSKGSRRRIDASLVVAGGVVCGLLALGTALLLRSWLGSDSGVGPTSAALNEAFGLLYGAEIGLAVGAAVAAFAVRAGPRIVTGLAAGLLGYALVLAPALIVTAPSDVSAAESIVIAAFAATLVLPAVLLGAAVGAAVARYRQPSV